MKTSKILLILASICLLTNCIKITVTVPTPDGGGIWYFQYEGEIWKNLLQVPLI